MAAAPADLGPAILPPGPSELRGVIQYSNFYLPKTYTKRIIIRFFDRDASAPQTQKKLKKNLKKNSCPDFDFKVQKTKSVFL